VKVYVDDSLKSVKEKGGELTLDKEKLGKPKKKVARTDEGSEGTGTRIKG